jgi:hypothetical protein
MKHPQGLNLQFNTYRATPPYVADLEAKICMRFEAMCPNPKLAPPNFAIVVIHAWILTYDLLVCLY